MKNIYFYMYYRISKFYLHPFLNGGKAKEKTEGVSGGFVIMSLFIAAIGYGIFYWGFGIRMTETITIWMPIICFLINILIFFRKKGLYLSLDKQYSKEPKLQKTIKGWAIFIIIIFTVLIQFWWLLQYPKNHPEFNGLIRETIAKIQI